MTLNFWTKTVDEARLLEEALKVLEAYFEEKEDETKQNISRLPDGSADPAASS
jgi:hypothetical protein